VEPVTTERLMTLSLLEEMPEHLKAKVAGVLLAVSEELDVEDNEVLMQEDHMAFESGYVLVQGTVQIEKAGRALSEVAGPAILGEMSQFKGGDTRTATVRAKGPALALYFHWDDFYAQAAKNLSEAEQRMLRDSMERLVWNRFGCQPLLGLSLFRGMSEQLRLKVCVMFPWIVERQTFGNNEVIFKEGGRCQSTGYLLVKGGVKLTKSPRLEKVYEAPNLIGVMPKQEPSLAWTATAIAQGDVEVFTFSWKTYTDELQKRLAPDEQRQLIDAMKQNAAEHFWH
jgi:hypothetical protein